MTGKPKQKGNAAEAAGRQTAFSQHGQVLRQMESDGMLVLNDQGSVVEVNGTICQLLGYRREEIVGKAVAEFHPTMTPTNWRRQWEQLKQKKGLQYEGWLKTKAGTQVPVEVMENYLELDGEAYDCAFARDITKRKQLETELRKSEAKFRGYFDLPLMGRAITGVTGEWLEVNDTLCRMLGYKREELVKMTWPELTHPDDLEKDVKRFRQVLAGQMDGYTLDKRFLRKNGQVLHTQLAVQSLRHPDGAVEAFLAVVLDISEQKQAEEERARLEAQNWQLQKAESLGRMAGAIAHHFNNQMQAVLMNLELANASLPKSGSSEVETLLEEAKEAANKAAAVSSMMLTYLGQTLGSIEVVDLSKRCQQNLAFLCAIKPQKILMATDFPASGPYIRGNANLLQQMLTNLVTNAWEASGEEEGAVRLTLTRLPGKEIPIKHRFPIGAEAKEMGYACLEISDSAKGMGEKEIEKIFDPFYSTKFTGRGMGLAVVLGIVRTHGGVITVESKRRRGSVFRVFLPEVSAGEIPNAEGSSQQKRLGEGTVLLVEVEEFMRKACTMALKQMGFTVLTASDGRKAVEVFRQHQDKICVVVCDQTMPQMDGWETLAELRKLAPNLPVIMSIGYHEDPVMQRQQAEQPQAFLQKPYAYQELKDTLAKVLTKG